jgi:hypothetical protein
MGQMTATDLIKQEFMNDVELAHILNVTKERIRDLRSKHKNGRIKFIDSYSPSSTITYFKVEEVRKYILDSKNDAMSKQKEEISFKEKLDD